MLQRDRNYYDLINYGLGGVSFQEFVDGFKTKYNELQVDGFDWDPQIQIDFTYEQLFAEINVATLPTVVDYDSAGPYKAPDKYEVGKDKIPRFKHGFALDEKIIREQLVFLQRGGSSLVNSDIIRDLLFNSIDKLLMGNVNERTYQRMQVVSTGSYALTAENNPAGLQGITFNFGVNTSSLTTTARWWSSSTHTTANEGSASDPVKNLREWVVNARRHGVPNPKIEISYELFTDMCGHSKVLAAVGHALYPSSPSDSAAAASAQYLGAEGLRAALERLVGAPIVVRDTIAYVEKFDKTTGKIVKTAINGFNVLNVAIVPDTQLGTIKAVQPIAVPDPGARLAFFDGGRTLIKQTFNSDTNTQYIQSECTALVVPSVAKYMYVYTVTA